MEGNMLEDSGSSLGIKHQNKINWIKEISHKLNTHVPLSKDDMSFMMSMCTSDNNVQYGEFIKMLSVGAMNHPDFNEDGVAFDNMLKLMHLQTNLFKATSQVGRDGSVERKNNLSVLNRLTERINKHKQEKVLRSHSMGEKSPRVVVDIPSVVVDDTKERNE